MQKICSEMHVMETSCPCGRFGSFKNTHFKVIDRQSLVFYTVVKKVKLSFQTKLSIGQMM